ncbi:MAG: PAS domain S-box protein [Desulfobacter sp.]|nr:MAG: PAS domain S-box protein [Desulfobacter sp.]
MGIDFPFFKSPQTMISTGFNFIVLNAITSFSVAALLKGLNSNEKRYRLMADNVADVIWTTDMNLNFTYISPSILQVQGYTPQEFMKKSIEQTLLPESFDMAISLYKSKLKQVEAKDKAAWDPVSFEAEQYCKDGTIIWTSIHARIILGPDNTPESILGITRDICEQKKNEKEKINAQIIAGEHKKLALVGQIAGKMAHDFNNVLGIIMGHAELALINTHDPEIRKTLDLIFNQTLRGKNLTKNLITFAKSTEPRQESFLINEKIDFVINLVKNDLDTIEVIKKDLVPLEIIADPGMIEHALVNLFQNSIHALSLSQAPQIIIRAYAVNDNIVFEIQDNGCGIPEEHLDNIYEPSFTLKGSRDEKGAYEPGIKGTGYGMANVKKYVELHKGRISVTSQAGHGTRVRICLPIIRKQLTSKEEQKIRDTTRHYNKQILLVEDEPAIADIQFNVLTHPPCSHAVDVASNGQAAIDLFETNHYDLISLDGSVAKNY